MIREGQWFTWRGQRLPYLDHPYNTTAENERAVEVPIALAFVGGRTGEGLEVGNVLAHYSPHEHRVVDLYEEGPGVDNLDVFEVTGEYDWIVAVSTVEHVRWDQPPTDATGATAAVHHLRSLLRPGGELLVTVPFGQHPHLDADILETGLGADEEGTLVYAESFWVPMEGVREWRPVRENRWARAVWIGQWKAS